MELCDKRAIVITAQSMEELEESLASLPGWKLGSGSTPDYPIALWRGEECINFSIKQDGRNFIVSSVNILPQDISDAPEKLTDDIIYKVYTHIRDTSDVSGVGVSLNLSRKDIRKLEEL